MRTQNLPHRWLVFGGSGAVGRFLLPALAEAGAEVLALSRAVQASELSGQRWLQGSLQHSAKLDAVLAEGEHFDVLSSLGPLDAFADWLERHPPAAGVRVLALSSLSAEWKQRSPNPAERALAASLLANEQRVLRISSAQGASATLLRCGLIHGAGTDRTLTPLLRFARRWPLPWPRAARGLRQPVHAFDLARAVLAAAARPELAQQLLSLPGPEALTFRCMLQRSLELEGLARRLIPLPAPGLRCLLEMAARGRGRISARAAALLRLYDDQLGAPAGWAQLGIPMDSLRRVAARATFDSSTGEVRNCQS
ncbi:NAD-dependent epimerase/dehydratase family protein [Aquimonas voraii]|uniref:Nucleoside-diphosphate-sugar epimerase n=1 Tax=Aquimonas voraii TaxID=265719 RepID=A0A1G6Z613_9GAMM|nr:NAD-dependent epimerase/dehydratase family protein [Aquimonas voraii]SDD97882.1 Nucleoside-diphosphate-sugar epimerase [Aquimonas voraii]